MTESPAWPGRRRLESWPDVEKEQNSKFACDSNELVGEPGGIRTPDLRLRRSLLYPSELRAR